MKEITPFTFRALTILAGCISLFSSLVTPHFTAPLPYEHMKLISPEVEPFFLVLIGFNLLLGLATVIGFCMFWRWSRPAAVASYVVGFIAYAMCAFFIDSGLKIALDNLSILLSGVVLSMAYFTPSIAKKFSP